jgi:hypothetical protein
MDHGTGKIASRKLAAAEGRPASLGGLFTGDGEKRCYWTIFFFEGTGEGSAGAATDIINAASGTRFVSACRLEPADV